MPATDKNGSSVAEIIKTQDTVYLKEITAPTGYRLNTSSYNVNLVANQTTSVMVPDQEQLGELTVYQGRTGFGWSRCDGRWCDFPL